MPFDLVLALSGLLAGAFGALLGLGGGILIVPILTLGFDMPLTAAVGTSLICVIATSAGGAAVNVRAGRADVRLGILLGAGTVVGALTGGVIAGILPERIIAALFAGLLAYTSYRMGSEALRRARATSEQRRPLAAPGADGETKPGHPQLPLALGGSFVAGNVSGLLGVGGGIVIVPLMHLTMGAPMRVAVATSNFMIGITAAAGAYAYLFRGDVDANVAAPVVLGVAIGSALGARWSGRVQQGWLVGLFVVVMLYVAFQMAIRALGSP